MSDNRQSDDETPQDLIDAMADATAALAREYREAEEAAEADEEDPA